MISKRIDKKPILTKETKKDVFNCFNCLAPKSIENKIPLPIHKPKRIDVKKVISVKEEPTAAKAEEPIYCPTIKVSAILYNCCNRFPKIIGIENNINDFVIFPLIR